MLPSSYILSVFVCFLRRKHTKLFKSCVNSFWHMAVIDKYLITCKIKPLDNFKNDSVVMSRLLMLLLLLLLLQIY